MGKGGEQHQSGTQNAQSVVHTDQRFAPFLATNFDAADFASKALAETHSSVQEQIDHLQSGIAVLDRHLRLEVLQRQQDLVARAVSLNDTDVALQRISLSVRSIQRVAARVRSEVNEPYQQIAAKAKQLKNLQSCIDLMRHVIHRYKLIQRLRTQMEANNTGILELAKAARLISDIAAVDAEVDLTGIDVVDADADFLATTSATVRAQIHAALRAGLDSLSQADVGSALQALFNLQELKSAVEHHIDVAVSVADRALSSALDPRKLTSSGATTGGGPASMVSALQGAAARVQDALWERLASALEQLRRSAMEVWHLQRVLLKKRDPLTHALFIDVVSPYQDSQATNKNSNNGSDCYDQFPLDKFWSKVCVAMGESFSAAYATQRGGFVRDSLITSYPRLAAMLRGNVIIRLTQDTAAASREAGPAISPDWEESFMATPSDLEAAFLAGAQARLVEAAGAAFPGGTRSLPTAADLQKLIARIHEELKEATEGGERLTAVVAAAAGRALLLAAERAELMAAAGPELKAVGPATPAQLRNVSLCNCLQEVDRSVAGLLPRLPDHAAAELSSALEAIQGAALDMIAPTFKATVDAVQDTLMKLHKLNLSADDGAEGTVVETSPYMRDISRILAQFRVEYLSKFSPSTASPQPSVARTLVERMTGRVLVIFVRHAALVRPLSQPGKLQLAKDASELEAAITQNLLPADQAGAPLRALRAFRKLLFTETTALLSGESSPPAASSAAASFKDLPTVALVHHLFSRAPAGLESPHIRNKLTPVQYSLWLDDHSQEEALAFIKTAIEAGSSKAIGQPGYDQVYPVLMKLVSN